MKAFVRHRHLYHALGHNLLVTLLYRNQNQLRDSAQSLRSTETDFVPHFQQLILECHLANDLVSYQLHGVVLAKLSEATQVSRFR